MLGSLLSSLLATLVGRSAREDATTPAPEPRNDHIALSDLQKLDQANLLIKLDYPYHPRPRGWDKNRSKIFDVIERGSDRYAGLLDAISAFATDFEQIPVHAEEADPLSPRWLNGWLPGLDAISLYGMLAIHNPRWYVEVGSGNSTMNCQAAGWVQSSKASRAGS